MAERGGRRQGTPGKSYANRKDLMVSRAPAQGTVSPASGGMSAPSQAAGQNLSEPSAPYLTPDEVPRPTDPTARPNEPLTAPLSVPMPSPQQNDAKILVRSLMLHSNNPDLARLLARMGND
ncbi:MAG: hypothetical protein ACOYB3_01700 [Azonexus sp.]